MGTAIFFQVAVPLGATELKALAGFAEDDAALSIALKSANPCLQADLTYMYDVPDETFNFFRTEEYINSLGIPDLRRRAETYAFSDEEERARVLETLQVLSQKLRVFLQCKVEIEELIFGDDDDL